MSDNKETTEQDPIISSTGSVTKNALNARELAWAQNPPNVLQKHVDANGPIVRTRFPPEPNGYLHIGHAKSMNMNFSLAFEKLGVAFENRRTIFRYDDTNPDAESKEYIDSLSNDLTWLGWKPERTTYSSDYFRELYEFAVTLIQKNLAYVCDMTKKEMELQRELALKRANARNAGKDPDIEAPIPSPDVLPGRNRDASAERNLELFEKMKMGLYDEGRYTLRLKMDLENSSNPNMYDLVAYRIKYTPHPHAGNGWCIYPAYDFTHGICDSLEDIDYSICTLEFETRREPYYWILWALDLYRPKVYEMSRLNLQYTVLSKRRLLKLVDQHYVRGWDDPRMPTISGLRRRGYTADIINSFCNDVGATRAQNVVEMDKLHQTARQLLSRTSRRLMGVLEPIKVVVTNYDETDHGKELTVQNSPTDLGMGTHVICLTKIIYLDASDFRCNDDSPDYYGLAPNKAVGLKYHGSNLICDNVVMKNDSIEELHCHLDTSPDRIKPKTHLSWVPSNAIPCEIRVYNHLFLVPEPSDLWEQELNPKSEILYPHAMVDPSVKEIPNIANVDPWKSNAAMQLERMGYFVVDNDSTFDGNNTGKLILNRTVSLKEEQGKKKLGGGETKSRKNEQDKQMQAKLARMQIAPEDLFKTAQEYQGKYSRYHPETGIPTHDIDGTELTKTAMKKLAKEKEKHVKALAKWKQTQGK